MKQTIPLTDEWQTTSTTGRYEYRREIDVSEDFQEGRVYLELRDLPESADISLNGVLLERDSGAPSCRLRVGDWIRAGSNDIAFGSDAELDLERLNQTRLVSYDKVSISSVDVDPDIVDRVANAWITIGVENHTGEEQDVLASVVVAQGECREKIEIAGGVTPFGGEIEAVIRITDPEMWEPNEAGERPMFDCLIGLQVEGEVMDVAIVRFDIA